MRRLRVSDVKLRQVRSSNGASPKQRGTLESLKLGRIGKESTMQDTPQLRGALDRVSHLVEEVKD